MAHRHRRHVHPPVHIDPYGIVIYVHTGTCRHSHARIFPADEPFRHMDQALRTAAALLRLPAKDMDLAVRMAGPPAALRSDPWTLP